MTEQFFIVAGDNQQGPYDLVTIVKKIRNGSVSRDTLVQQEEMEGPKPAIQLPALAVFFTDKKDEATPVEEASKPHKRGIIRSLQTGLVFLQHNMVSSIFSGLFVLVIIGLIGLVHVATPASAHIFFYMLIFVFSHFLLSLYQLSALRMSRGQPVDTAYLVDKIVPAIRPLFILSLLVTIPSLIGLVLFANGEKWAVSLAGLDPTLLTEDRVWEIPLVGLMIFVIPGMFVLAIYSLAPLLILDQGYGFWEAMGMSRKVTIGTSLENSSIFYALYIINFFAGLLALLPMAVTLPLTMGALAEIYDETYGS